MADEHNNEILMQIVDTTGAIPAECRTELNTDWDDLVLDYTNGTFFAVDDFNFNMKLRDEDQATDSANTTGAPGVGAAGLGKQQGPHVDFGRWVKAPERDKLKTIKYPLTMEEFSITRRYDCASPVLFEKCARSAGFPSASIVKRKVVGGDKLQTFLRLDFVDVLITKIEWQDAEVVKETISFVFRELTFKYKTQKHNGTLNQIQDPPHWKYEAALRNSKAA